MFLIFYHLTFSLDLFQNIFSLMFSILFPQMVLDTLGEEEAMKPRPPGIFTDIANETK